MTHSNKNEDLLRWITHQQTWRHQYWRKEERSAEESGVVSPDPYPVSPVCQGQSPASYCSRSSYCPQLPHLLTQPLIDFFNLHLEIIQIIYLFLFIYFPSIDPIIVHEIGIVITLLLICLIHYTYKKNNK